MGNLFWKRVYEPTTGSDGSRILIDRLWPRGLNKERADIDYWAKSITPSKELRQKYHNGELSFEIFAQKYEDELNSNPDIPDFKSKIRELLQEGNVTLVYASKTPEMSHIPILRKKLGYLEGYGIVEE